jgi:hypothetical protein
LPAFRQRTRAMKAQEAQGVVGGGLAVEPDRRVHVAQGQDHRGHAPAPAARPFGLYGKRARGCPVWTWREGWRERCPGFQIPGGQNRREWIAASFIPPHQGEEIHPARAHLVPRLARCLCRSCCSGLISVRRSTSPLPGSCSRASNTAARRACSWFKPVMKGVPHDPSPTFTVQRVTVISPRLKRSPLLPARARDHDQTRFRPAHDFVLRLVGQRLPGFPQPGFRGQGQGGHPLLPRCLFS